MRRLAALSVVALMLGPVGIAAAFALHAGTPATRLPDWETAGFRAPFSYENTTCYDACAEQIARLKAEEAARVAAKKKAEADAAAARARTRVVRRSISPNSDAAWVETFPRCAKCGEKHVVMRNIVTGRLVPSACMGEPARAPQFVVPPPPPLFP